MRLGCLFCTTKNRNDPLLSLLLYERTVLLKQQKKTLLAAKKVGFSLNGIALFFFVLSKSHNKLFYLFFSPSRIPRASRQYKKKRTEATYYQKKEITI